MKRGIGRGVLTWRRRPAPPVEAAEIAYVMNLFPNLTETFVYREVEAVRALGRTVLTISIRRPDADGVSAEARSYIARTQYVLPVSLHRLVGTHAATAYAMPRRYFGTLALLLGGAHASWRDRLRTLCHFVEAVTLLPTLRAAGVRHLHAHFAVGSATVAWAAARLLGLPFSMTAHAYDIWLDRLLLPEKLAAADLVVTCTEHSRDHLVAQCPEAASRIHRIYHGVDVARFRPQITRRAGRFRILSVGRLVEQKGFRTLLRAVARLVASGHDVECVIVGDGPLRTELEAEAVALGVSDRVRFIGRVFQEAMPALYREADVFALACQRSADGDMDGIPNVLWEAMASGLPAVSTILSGVPEAVADGSCGLLVEPGDAGGLAGALERLARDPGFRRRLGAEARRRAVGWPSVEASARALLQRIDELGSPAGSRERMASSLATG